VPVGSQDVIAVRVETAVGAGQRVDVKALAVADGRLRRCGEQAGSQDSGDDRAE
jgi:hypothetical protein